MTPAGMSEEAYQQAIRELATIRRWAVYHTHDSRRSTAGFPDLVLVRGHRLIFAELKARGGRVTQEQIGWLNALGQVELVQVALWQDGVTPMPDVERVLR